MRKHHRIFRRKSAVSPLAPREVIINRNYCDGCAECVTVCPNYVLILQEITSEEYKSLSDAGKLNVILKGRQKSSVRNIEACVFCGLCEDHCHETAIAVGR